MHNKLMLGLALGYTSIVTYYSLVDSSEVPSLPLNFDKLGHFVFYFGTTISWFLYFNSRKSSKGYKNALKIAFLISFVYGILIEVLQGLLTASRQPDIKDVFANTFGAILAALLVLLTKQYLKSKK